MFLDLFPFFYSILFLCLLLTGVWKWGKVAFIIARIRYRAGHTRGMKDGCFEFKWQSDPWMAYSLVSVH